MARTRRAMTSRFVFFHHIFELARRGLGQGLLWRVGGSDNAGFCAAGGIDRGHLDHVSLHNKFYENLGFGGVQAATPPMRLTLQCAQSLSITFTR